jgi:FAD/FMN-containing dehydrogenase
MTLSSVKTVGLSRLARAFPGTDVHKYLVRKPGPQCCRRPLEWCWRCWPHSRWSRVLFLFQLSSFTVETKAHMGVAGYSWKTREYGLTVDSVTEFRLVLPNGTQTVVDVMLTRES